MFLVNGQSVQFWAAIFLNNEFAILKTILMRGHEIYACVVSASLLRLFPCARRPLGFLSFFKTKNNPEKNYVVFISQDKTNNKETSGMAKKWIIY